MHKNHFVQVAVNTSTELWKNSKNTFMRHKKKKKIAKNCTKNDKLEINTSELRTNREQKNKISLCRLSTMEKNMNKM